MLQEDLFHFPRRDLFTPAIDDFLDAALDEKVAVRVEAAQVSGAEPAVGKGLVRKLIGVTLHDVRPTDDDLTHLTLRHQPRAADFHDGSFCTRRHTDGTRLAKPGGQRIASHLVRGLCHSISFDNRDAEPGFELCHQCRRERRRTGTDESQAPTLDRLAVLRTSGHNCPVHGGHGGIPGRLESGGPVKKARGIKARRRDHTPPGAKRRQHRRHETVNVEKRHDVQAPIGLRERQRVVDMAGGGA